MHSTLQDRRLFLRQSREVCAHSSKYSTNEDLGIRDTSAIYAISYMHVYVFHGFYICRGVQMFIEGFRKWLVKIHAVDAYFTWFTHKFYASEGGSFGVHTQILAFQYRM